MGNKAEMYAKDRWIFFVMRSDGSVISLTGNICHVYFQPTFYLVRPNDSKVGVIYLNPIKLCI